MNEDVIQVACPTCGRSVEWRADSKWRPFCSERCKLIDLGDWLAEQHRIPDASDPNRGDPH